jgi:protein gp37
MSGLHNGENRAAQHMPSLLAVPARVRFLSCEPLIEPIEPALDGITWVICGDESHLGSRMMEPAWTRQLPEQVRASSTAFFRKQVTSGRSPRS